jgi:hypothetical protein
MVPLLITMTTDLLARTPHLLCSLPLFLYAQVHDDSDSIGWLTKLQTPEIIAELRAIGNVRLVLPPSAHNHLHSPPMN